ncbi:bifunctional methylenetetrahydrofolate dehydrogenase/methenyltetrahydrofolate cyclohydrolase, partial [Candidatus Berkelbacteria bacterium]|nr:bifunctional methylenetetrahydrofolate dehydrogenase/methenyltetrahydrofolate cyclohydrolase [Candidatus Berkelbacteria bacterium]
MLLLDGRPIAKAWREELKEKITSLKSKGIEPQLGIILIGDDPASVMYTNLKSKVAQSLGIQADLIHLPTNTTTDEAVTAVTAVNEKRAVHAILIQLPLPDQIDTDRVLATIDRQKDADGLHPHSLGDLLIGNERAVPATPKGIFRLLEAYHISTVSKHVVIIGRSNILGKPLAAMFLNRNATVTICHSKTPDLSHFTHQADILVMDTGVPGLLTK